MNLEKLGLMLFLKAAQDHEAIKMHLKNSAQEMAKAGLEGWKLLQTIAAENEVGPKSEKTSEDKSSNAFKTDFVQHLTSLVASKSKSRDELMRQIVGEILQVLDEEKQACQNTSDAHKSLKTGYLDAISLVLRQRFLSQNDAALTQQTASKKQVRKA